MLTEAEKKVFNTNEKFADTLAEHGKCDESGNDAGTGHGGTGEGAVDEKTPGTGAGNAAVDEKEADEEQEAVEEQAAVDEPPAAPRRSSAQTLGHRQRSTSLLEKRLRDAGAVTAAIEALEDIALSRKLKVADPG